MSQYNEYAKRLDTAFKEATEAHNNALAAYQDADKAYRDENDPAKKRVRAAVRNEKEQDLKRVQRNAWRDFRNKRDAIGRELEKAVTAAQLADPDALDEKAVTLLNSGVLKGADLESMADKYADNPTMLRMIGQHAHDRARDEKDPAEMRRLSGVSYNCANARPETLKQWDDLRGASAHYSGEHNHHAAADMISKLATHWDDDNVRAAIDNF